MEKIIKEFKYNDFTDKNGNKWYKIIFESGEEAKWGTQKELSKGLKIDCDIIETEDKNGNKYNKVKLIQNENSGGGQGGGYKLEAFEHKAATMSACYAKDCFIAGKIKGNEIKKYFDSFYNMIISKKVS